MGHRIVKRVPMDFDAPLNDVWCGYGMPDELRPTCCPTCGSESRRNPFVGPEHHIGDGRTPAARAIADTFYSHNIGGSRSHADRLAWSDKLGQVEVDKLVAEGRLRELRLVPEDEQCGQPCADAPEGAVWRGDPCHRPKGHDGNHHPSGHEWVTVPRTAAEINAANGRQRGLDLVHDGISRYILIDNRCELLGIQKLCATCEGDGAVYASDEQHAAADAWEPSDPPTGEGWQLWETTTEGSPQSPVFASAETLAEWCESNATAFADIRWTAAEWLASFVGGTTDIDTLLVMRGPEHISP